MSEIEDQVHSINHGDQQICNHMVYHIDLKGEAMGFQCKMLHALRHFLRKIYMVSNGITSMQESTTEEMLDYRHTSLKGKDRMLDVPRTET